MAEKGKPWADSVKLLHHPSPHDMGGQLVGWTHSETINPWSGNAGEDPYRV